jgi:hypothetical protein
MKKHFYVKKLRKKARNKLTIDVDENFLFKIVLRQLQS